MRSTRIILIIILLLGLPISLVACSGGKSPLTPAADLTSNGGPDLTGEALGNRSVVTVYDALIDPNTGMFTISLDERDLMKHVPLTQTNPNVLSITGYGFVPNFWANIRLSHPSPGNGINYFDPRVIAILPANNGVSFNYPAFNAKANNKVLMEPDGYTKLFDNLGTNITGNTNPFKAYFKSQPYRVWSNTGTTIETQRWDMNLSGFGGPLSFKLVVDVSTNTPNPPQPVTDNAAEPVQISASVGDGLTQSGGNANITVTLLDWQGNNGIGGVKVAAPDLFTGAANLFYSGPGLHPNEYIYTGTLKNRLGATAGEHHLLVLTWDQQTSVAMFNEFPVYVGGDIAFNPVDVTPSWLSFTPEDVCINGNYAYLACGLKGLQIFDVSDTNNPRWIKKVNTSMESIGVRILNGYAYMLNPYGLCIVDIDPVQSAYVVKEINTNGSFGTANDLDVEPGYAYISDQFLGLQILDIDPPESVNVVNTVPALYYAGGVDVKDGFAYVVTWDNEASTSGLRIIDVDPPESAHEDKYVHLYNFSNGDVFVENGYAYVIQNEVSMLDIVDVDPVDTAYYVYGWEINAPAHDICISNGYAFLASYWEGMQIVSLDPLHSVPPVNTNGSAMGLDISGNKVYVADEQTGLHIIDISNPEAANIIKTAYSMYYNCNDIYIDNGYAFTSNNSSGMYIIDIDPLQLGKIVSHLPTQYLTGAVYAYGGYAYLIEAEQLEIVDISSIYSPHTIKTIPIPVTGTDVFAVGNYLYATDKAKGLMIIDISDPENASVINTIDTPGLARSVFVSGNYAYVADDTSGLQIIDISQPVSASIVKTVDTPDLAKSVYLSSGYAYVADGWSGLQIIDISPLSSAYICSSVSTMYFAYHVTVSNGYAYVADSINGLEIVDITPPETASIVKTVDTPADCFSVDVHGNYAYLADLDDNNYGPRIIKLW